MADGTRLLPPLGWSAAQAGQSLTLASTAWLLSGLTASPLINGLLPALVTLPVLLPLAGGRRASLLQPAGTAALLALAAAAPPAGAAIPVLLTAVGLTACGHHLSRFPLQERLRRETGIGADPLRRAAELGALAGALLSGVLFPLGKAVAQYGTALLLFLPLLAPAAAALPPAEPMPPAAPRIRLVRAGVLQGLLFGGLIAFLALWVRTVGEGTCLDFGLLLAAYGLGRLAMGRGPVLPAPARYLGLSGLLALTQLLPGWAALLLFLPIGWLAGGSDAALVRRLELDGRHGGRSRCWEVLERSGAVGGLLGSLGLGLVAQLIGLTAGFPLLLAGFLAMALLTAAGTP